LLSSAGLEPFPYRGAGLDIVWPQMAAITGIGALFFAISLQCFRTAIASFQS
jgi:ABC-2 type transport system permease protein